MGSVSKALIVFLRFPERGKVKTRLAEAVGAEESCRIYQRLCRRTLGIVADFKRLNRDLHVFLYFTPLGRLPQMQQTFPGPWRYVPQEGTHLGDRMEKAFGSVRDKGYRQTVLIGTDILDIERQDLEEAFAALERDNAVLGPSADGGYYLIGLTRPCHAVFDCDIWGTGDVYSRSSRILLESGFELQTTRERQDVDRPEDLRFLHANAFFKKLSVIIPTLGSPEQLSPLLVRLKSLLWPGDEIVVVKGSDRVTEGARQVAPDVVYASSARGRGLQLNCGVGFSSGEVLLFLHDDCYPPPAFPYSVRTILRTPGKSLGCFHLGFAPTTPLLTLIAKWANLRTRLLRMPYGDQGMFCTRDMFENVGGFQKRYLMEDVDFAERCMKRGTLLMLPDAVLTSPGRYLKKGILRASLQNHRIMLLYRFGTEDEKLYSIYYS